MRGLPAIFFLFVAAVVAGANAPSPVASGLDFTLPVFTREGYRTLILRGSKATSVPSGRAEGTGNSPAPDQIDVTDMNLTLFTGDATNRVDVVLLSPFATYLPDAKSARGDKSVRIVRDDMELSGEKWSYDYVSKAVLIEKKVHVVFNSSLTAILK